ncbi:MAG TPA: hypothetical protein VH599_08445 [Ktedonobacterales bacterium]|jgi:hypothetical protein
MTTLEQAIQTLLDTRAADLVRFAWGQKGTTFQKALPPLPVFDAQVVVSHLCRVQHGHNIGLVHLQMQATPNPLLSESIFEQGSGVWCETHLPVLSTLYWLAKGHAPPSSPYQWMVDGRPMLQWFFRIIDITSLSAATLLHSELPGLLPLIPFTQDADSKTIERARQQLPTALPRKQIEQLETLLLFFWEYVQRSSTD